MNPTPNSFTTLPLLVTFIHEHYQNPSHLNSLSQNQWIPVSTEKFSETIKYLALGFHHLGLKPGDGFGVLAEPSPEWIMVDLAVMIAGGVTVPFFANVSLGNLEFEIKDSNMRYLFMAKPERWESMQLSIASLEKVVFQSPVSGSDKYLSLAQVRSRGEELARSQPGLFAELIGKVREEDLATIIYTSGSTGRPKGVEITQRNLVSQIQDASQRIPLVPGQDILLSCLPLAHIFERMVMYYYLSTGCSIYIADDVKKVGEMLPVVRPTVMTMVPRLLEKVHAKMALKASQNHGLKKILAQAAFRRALARDPGGNGGVLDRIYDRLVYAKLRQALGGRLRLIFVGGAALSKTICRFFLNAGIPVYEGYGLTEASPVVSTNSPGQRKPHTVGKSFPSVLVKISPEGEILAKGPNIMRGYHNNPDATRAVIDTDGWLHTGDKGELDAEGYLTITGRIKELFKTSNGKYVAPVPIEQALAEHEFVDQAVVIADQRNFVSCLLVPDFEKLQHYKDTHGFGGLSDKEFLEGYFVQQEMNTLLGTVNQRLDHWEQVHKFTILPQPLTIEAGEITPKMNVCRHVVERKYQAEISRMYPGE
jgi:long-chain acyl-CoA synthetase